MAKFETGNPGKPKGAVTKATKLVKEVFAEVFTELQNDPNAKLVQWAKKNPTEFYKLASKLIPIQLSGDKDNPLHLLPEIKIYNTAPPLAGNEKDVNV